MSSENSGDLPPEERAKEKLKTLEAERAKLLEKEPSDERSKALEKNRKERHRQTALSDPEQAEANRKKDRARKQRERAKKKAMAEENAGNGPPNDLVVANNRVVPVSLMLYLISLIIILFFVLNSFAKKIVSKTLICKVPVPMWATFYSRLRISKACNH